MQQFLVVLCGLPSSGKTTLAHEIANEIPDEEKVAVVSTDDWRDEDYYANFEPEKENRVRELALKETNEKLEDGFSVIHDDTNYYSSMRHELLELAREFQCSFSVVHVSTNLSRAIQWNNTRDSNIPQFVIERIEQRFDVPGSKYAWDEPLSSVDLGEVEASKAASNIVKKLTSLDPVQKKEADAVITNPIDVATRKFIGEFLRDNPELRNKQIVSDVRKSIVQIARERNWGSKKALEQLSIELKALQED